jgi:hypothetical protein
MNADQDAAEAPAPVPTLEEALGAAAQAVRRAEGEFMTGPEAEQYLATADRWLAIADRLRP